MAQKDPRLTAGLDGQGQQPAPLADDLWRAMELTRFRRPLPLVLDTSAVRTGLHFQLCYGTPPATIRQGARRELRLYMERETLEELIEKVPKFARQFRVEPRQLLTILNEGWLPHIRVVRLPANIRLIDERALDVRARDVDDYAAAALAALLSPCILLTHDVKHFAPLGIKEARQGVEAAQSVVAMKREEGRAQAAIVAPAVPPVLTVVGLKALADRYGPVVWLLAALAGGAGAVLYSRQPAEKRHARRQRIGEIVNSLLESAAAAHAAAEVARRAVADKVVPGPVHRSIESAVLRELAVADESLSAQQIAELLADANTRPSVGSLRAWLHDSKPELVAEVRRGGFLLGQQLRINIPAAPNAANTGSA